LVNKTVALRLEVAVGPATVFDKLVVDKPYLIEEVVEALLKKIVNEIFAVPVVTLTVGVERLGAEITGIGSVVKLWVPPKIVT
jgi:hypothetical protein